MSRARPFLLLPLLAITACQTQRKPLTGFTSQPPGTILLDNTTATGSMLVVWPIFDLPQTEFPTPSQTFLPRLNGQDAAIKTSDEGFYDYVHLDLEGWTGGYSNWINGIPPGTYTLELDNGDGESFGSSAPVPLPAPSNPIDLSSQTPAVMFTHYAGQQGSWVIDPSTRDSDPTTDEITVTNLIDADVAVERCLVSGGALTSCTSVGTVASGADLRTVETLAAVSATADHQALFIHLASDATQFYQRDLLQGPSSINYGESCQIERILVHGVLPVSAQIQTGTQAFAMSSCYGYQSSDTFQ